MRFGLALPHYDTSYGGRPASWDNVERVARLAEASGFDSVWVSDHLFLDWSKYGGPSDTQGSLECWTTMSALAAVTERVRIGSLVLCNDLRNPALLAKMVASLDLLSDGRIDVGMGAGWYEPEYEAAGLESSTPAQRIRRVGEAVEIMTRLLEGEELKYSGRHYRIDGAICRPGPAQRPHPPIWMGGKGDLLLETAARVADGWNYSWIGSLEDYAARAETADRMCEKAGRDPATLRRSVGVYVLAGGDDSDLRRRFARLAERTPAGVLGDSTGSEVSLEEFRRTRVAGTAGEVKDKLRELSSLGVEEAVLCLGAIPFQLADEEDVEFVGAEVVAAL